MNAAKQQPIPAGLIVILAGLVISGCRPAPAIDFQSSDKVLELSPELQKQVRTVLETHCGTPERPKLLGNDAIATDHLLHGREVYLYRCDQCHGATGDGQGEAARWLNPRPRDYRRGRFKFTSTPYDTRPLRTDLLRTLRAGVPGTSMPAFNLLPAGDLEAPQKQLLLALVEEYVHNADTDAADLQGIVVELSGDACGRNQLLQHGESRRLESRRLESRRLESRQIVAREQHSPRRIAAR